MSEFDNVTTSAKVEAFEASSDIFDGLIQEMRELSKKKPDATLSKHKVDILNRILADVQAILEDEPEARYLDLLDDGLLPQNSDAVLVMVQHETALAAFEKRYNVYLPHEFEHRWVTEDTLEEIQQYADSDGD